MRGGGAVLRSKSPDLVKQEIWALLLARYAVRKTMTAAADEAGEDPDRLSCIRSLRVTRRQVADQADFPLTGTNAPSARPVKESSNGSTNAASAPTPGRPPRPPQLLPRQARHRHRHPPPRPPAIGILAAAPAAHITPGVRQPL
jgi:hypothetical protein